MIDKEKLIEIYDNNHTNKKDLFDIYEINFSNVYGKSVHAMRNPLIDLINAESDDITTVRGYLKLSVSVLNEDDNKIE